MFKALKKITQRIYYRNISMTRSLATHNTITPDQLKAARALLGWSQADLAKKSGYSLPAINNIERGLYKAHSRTLDDIVQTFETNGIQFIDGPGVRVEDTALRVKCYEGEDALHYLCNKIKLALENTDEELLMMGIDEAIFKELAKKDLPSLQKALAHNPVRIIAHKKQSAALNFSSLKKKVVSDEAPLIPCMLYKERSAVVLLDNPVHVLIIYNDSLARSYKSYFNHLWNSYK